MRSHTTSKKKPAATKKTSRGSKAVSGEYTSVRSARGSAVQTHAVLGAYHYMGSNFADFNEFVHLQDFSGMTTEQLAPVVGMTSRTLQNKKGSGTTFNLPVTERLRSIIELFEEGVKIFGNKEEFIAWLGKPAYGLDYAVPQELLQKPGGLRKVTAELSAIKFGDTV
jgi:putative toxin-antitoxin system antitoxin component (TIGR02293 family)